MRSKVLFPEFYRDSVKSSSLRQMGKLEVRKSRIALFFKIEKNDCKLCNALFWEKAYFKKVVYFTPIYDSFFGSYNKPAITVPGNFKTAKSREKVILFPDLLKG